MLHFDKGIHLNDKIIRCFLLWMSYQSKTIAIVDSLCFNEYSNGNANKKIFGQH